MDHFHRRKQKQTRCVAEFVTFSQSDLIDHCDRVFIKEMKMFVSNNENQLIGEKNEFNMSRFFLCSLTNFNINRHSTEIFFSQQSKFDFLTKFLQLFLKKNRSSSGVCGGGNRSFNGKLIDHFPNC